MLIFPPVVLYVVMFTLGSSNKGTVSSSLSTRMHTLASKVVIVIVIVIIIVIVIGLQGVDTAAVPAVQPKILLQSVTTEIHLSQVGEVLEAADHLPVHSGQLTRHNIEHHTLHLEISF